MTLRYYLPNSLNIYELCCLLVIYDHRWAIIIVYDLLWLQATTTFRICDSISVAASVAHSFLISQDNELFIPKQQSREMSSHSLVPFCYLPMAIR